MTGFTVSFKLFSTTATFRQMPLTAGKLSHTLLVLFKFFVTFLYFLDHDGSLAAALSRTKGTSVFHKMGYIAAGLTAHRICS